MMTHWKALDKDALRRRVGSMDQIAGIRLVELADGRERPGRAAMVHTGSGFEFTVLIDRCLDVAAASFCGQAMGGRSKVGDAAPQYYEHDGKNWLRSYFGGLVATCGLINVGAPSARSAELGSGLHGRIGNTPAQNLSIVQEWRGADYVLQITGTMRETTVFGENLTLTRTISTKLGETRFWIHDVVTNDGFNATPYMLLYHCNIGWPALDEGACMISPTRRIAPRDDAARDGADEWGSFSGPIHEYAEKVYYHEIVPDDEGWAAVAIVNGKPENAGLFGACVRYRPEQLPRFVQWKQLGEQDYVVGLEPCNCGVEGRDVDEAHGLLHTLAPGEEQHVDIEFGAVTTQHEVARLSTAAAAVKPEMTDSYLDFVEKPA